MSHLTKRVWTGEDAWDGLRAELDAWAAAGRVASLWWRDDDAVRRTPALDRLVALAAGTPLAVAVIPAVAEAFDLPVTVLQHGWAHADHARRGERKCELVGEAVLDDLSAGKRRLEALFGARFLPVMVPPWNRLAGDVAARLRELGFIGLSTLGPRCEKFSANVHVDVMDWKTGSFAGEGSVLAATVGHLSARRAGAVDADEPTGLMTHHLVHDAAAERFLERLLAATKSHPAVRWRAAPDIFAAA